MPELATAETAATSAEELNAELSVPPPAAIKPMARAVCARDDEVVVLAIELTTATLPPPRCETKALDVTLRLARIASLTFARSDGVT